MKALIVIIVLAIGAALSARIIKQYQEGVLFRLGRVRGPREPGFRLIIPVPLPPAARPACPGEAGPRSWTGPR